MKVVVLTGTNATGKTTFATQVWERIPEVLTVHIDLNRIRLPNGIVSHLSLKRLKPSPKVLYLKRIVDGLDFSCLVLEGTQFPLVLYDWIYTLDHLVILTYCDPDVVLKRCIERSGKIPKTFAPETVDRRYYEGVKRWVNKYKVLKKNGFNVELVSTTKGWADLWKVFLKWMRSNY